MCPFETGGGYYNSNSVFKLKNMMGIKAKVAKMAAALRPVLLHDSNPSIVIFFDPCIFFGCYRRPSNTLSRRPHTKRLSYHQPYTTGTGRRSSVAAKTKRRPKVTAGVACHSNVTTEAAYRPKQIGVSSNGSFFEGFRLDMKKTVPNVTTVFLQMDAVSGACAHDY